MFYAIAERQTKDGAKSTVLGDIGNTRLMAELVADLQAKEIGAKVVGVYLLANYRKVNQRVFKSDLERLKKQRLLDRNKK